MKPSIGRNVHFVGFGQPCVASLITLVIPELHVGAPNDSVALIAFPPGSDSEPVDYAYHDEDHEAGTWHWPEMV